MSASSTNASAKSLTPLANSTFNDCVTQSSPLTVDASFQFVDVWDLGTIDLLLKHTPHCVVNQVQVWWVRRPDIGWDEIGHLVIQQLYCVFGAVRWRIVLLKNEKLASRCCTNVGKQHLSQKRRRNNMPHWFWPLVRARECYWHRNWTLLRRPSLTS